MYLIPTAYPISRVEYFNDSHPPSVAPRVVCILICMSLASRRVHVLVLSPYPAVCRQFLPMSWSRNQSWHRLADGQLGLTHPLLYRVKGP